MTSARMAELASPMETLCRAMNKQADLELAVAVGEALLNRNQELAARNDFLEAHLQSAEQHLAELQAEMDRKVALLHRYVDGADTMSISSCGGEPGTSTPGGNGRAGGTGSPGEPRVASPRQRQRQAEMERRLREIQRENESLAMAADRLRAEVVELREKEQNIVGDSRRQLHDQQRTIDQLRSALEEQTRQCELKLEASERAANELRTLKSTERHLAEENHSLWLAAAAARDAQESASRQLVDMQERYAELAAMLFEMQDELSVARRGYRPKQRAHSPADSLYESLASELESSDNGLPGMVGPTHNLTISGRLSDLGTSPRSGPGTSTPAPSSLESTPRTVDVVKDCQLALAACAPHTHRCETIFEVGDECCGASPIRSRPDVASKKDSAVQACTEINIAASETVSATRAVDSPGSSAGTSLSAATATVARTPSSDSLVNYAGPEMGQPGVPGTRDLDYALRRADHLRTLRRRYESDFEAYYGRRKREDGDKATGRRREQAAGNRPASKRAAASAQSQNIHQWSKMATVVPSTVTPPNTPTFSSLPTLMRQMGIRPRVLIDSADKPSCSKSTPTPAADKAASGSTKPTSLSLGLNELRTNDESSIDRLLGRLDLHLQPTSPKKGVYTRVAHIVEICEEPCVSAVDETRSCLSDDSVD